MPTTTRPRMPGFDYNGRAASHVTIVTAGRSPALTGSMASEVIAALLRSVEALDFELLAFVVMPDHVHVLVCGRNEESNLVGFVQRFKQLTGFAHKRMIGQRLWQPSFHDHVLHRDEDVRVVAQYIAENPVRAGLVREDEVWAYQGGTLLE
jgi:REP element-mobilizing transposase RayT